MQPNSNQHHTPGSNPSSINAVLRFGAAFLVLLLVIATGILLVTIMTRNETSLPFQATPVFQNELSDIPPQLLPLYVEAAADQCQDLPWTVLAGIGKVESNHGRHEGAGADIDGEVTPHIIGIALDGTNGTVAVADTDDGVYDGDTQWDRAIGPLQFIPESWERYGVDGNGDGIKDPHNIYDATYGAANHLCRGEAVTDVEEAVFSYNRSRSYVDKVLNWSRRYNQPYTTTGAVLDGYAYPVPSQWATADTATRTHHDYPAADLVVPAGTPAYAIVDGTIEAVSPSSGDCGRTVVLRGDDGVGYTYCLLLDIGVTVGERVSAGQAIALSGLAPASSATGSHLHVSIRTDSGPVCPQPVLLSLVRGRVLDPSLAPGDGCFEPGPVTDWGRWLDDRSESLGAIDE